MLGRLILLIALVGAVLWFLHWFRRTPPERVAKLLRRSLLWGAVGVLVLLAVSGRLHPLFAALPAAVPVVIRVLNLLRLLPMIRQAMHALGLSGRSGATAGTGGQTSSIRTRFLEMTLDHASGEMDGLVLEGPFQGHRLSALNPEQLVDLLLLCRSADDQSAAVLEAYLDRVRGGDWRERTGGAGAAPPPAEAALTPEEALAILGLAQGASKREIRAAHRRLMQRFHPDRGGSDYLAAKINAAKRLLLDE
ncbi:DnaJ domain-containing protein [Candidatus Thiosymbion oneisti]|uniref:DnaJ domain-containing protein n=1 Tax=Candidatus Thiosymbion oneisti TaxID=589554 RepID=UPI000B7CD197|nr:DnaJ domain-containing protein [Candidatus Thiosymbion oneisti]